MSTNTTQFSLQEIANMSFDATNQLPRTYNATVEPGMDDTNSTQAVTIKPITAGTYSPSLATNSYLATANTSFNAKASAGVLSSVFVSNINAGLRYIQFHNLATAPAGGETPVMSFPIPAGTATVPTNLTLNTSFWQGNGRYFSTGIAVTVSTTLATYTAATGTDHIVNVNYF